MDREGSDGRVLGFSGSAYPPQLCNWFHRIPHFVILIKTHWRSAPVRGKKGDRIMKLIGIEEHFLTADIRAAWASSSIGQEGIAGFERGDIEERLDDPGF